ncbi:hypothetical protein R3X28_05120 [Maribacter sp. TH_r10]|uniref:hypothetical protein n=1 Tax=Maribacter sp. TH_r10 TaxID=3082086 RepID=UPI0029539A24|nr:hypothetical protein [Maribacter sp. TH_r10]MDV7138244.1 hypothetical protein [Maribacter sp. TH_r10]
MKNIEFKTVNGKANNIITMGVFLKEGQPFAYGHFDNNETNSDLCLAFPEDYANTIDISSFVLAVHKETGLFKGLYCSRVTYNDIIVNSTISAYMEQKKSTEMIS